RAERARVELQLARPDRPQLRRARQRVNRRLPLRLLGGAALDRLAVPGQRLVRDDKELLRVEPEVPLGGRLLLRPAGVGVRLRRAGVGTAEADDRLDGDQARLPTMVDRRG